MDECQKCTIKIKIGLLLRIEIKFSEKKTYFINDSIQKTKILKSVVVFLHDNHQKLRNALLKSKFVSADSIGPELTRTNSEYLYCSLLGQC